MLSVWPYIQYVWCPEEGDGDTPDTDEPQQILELGRQRTRTRSWGDTKKDSPPEFEREEGFANTLALNFQSPGQE